MDVQSLAPLIRNILMDPGTDLTSVSAKRVRKELVVRGTPEDVVQDAKKDIDALIAEVFESVSAAVGGVEAAPSPPSPGPSKQPDGGNGKRKREDAANGNGNGHANGFDGSDDEEDLRTPKKQKSKKQLKRQMSDAELARQLSAELNANPSRRGGQSIRPARGPSRTPKKVKKSRDTIDDSSDGFSDADSAGVTSSSPTKKKKKSGGGGGGGGGGFQKPLILSPPLADLLHTDRLSRPQVVKKLWEYIKANELQNASNKRQILCDTQLRAVFKQDKVDMFTMNKLLKDHLTPVD